MPPPPFAVCFPDSSFFIFLLAFFSCHLSSFSLTHALFYVIFGILLHDTMPDVLKILVKGALDPQTLRASDPQTLRPSDTQTTRSQIRLLNKGSLSHSDTHTHTLTHTHTPSDRQFFLCGVGFDFFCCWRLLRVRYITRVILSQ